MGTYAMLSGNTVDNVIVADNKEETEHALRCVLIELTPDNPAGIGYAYDPETRRFTPPATDEQ